jgi:uncharacterized protein (TIGR00296 family)
MFELTKEEGKLLVKLARRAVETYLKVDGQVLPVPRDIPLKFRQPCGVFVTINSVRGNQKVLRGCIGYPYPTTPLAQAVIESAINSATEDPRFPPLSFNELEEVVFEISVLTPPELIEVKTPREYPSKIKVGVDGLMVEWGIYKGLLLPQVPVEWKWDEEEFLSQCCIKAGLPPDSWLIKGVKIYKFSCVIAEEITPNGKVEIRDLRKELQT